MYYHAYTYDVVRVFSTTGIVMYIYTCVYIALHCIYIYIELHHIYIHICMYMYICIYIY